MTDSISPEIWKAIPDFPDYEASSHGRIRSHKGKQPRILRPAPNRYDYLQVMLFRNGAAHNRRVHQLVMLAFVGPRNGLEVCHADANRQNNCLSNLRYDTHSENMRDVVRAGYHHNQGGVKTHCKRGHEFNDENTRIRNRDETHVERTCLACERERHDAQYARRKARNYALAAINRNKTPRSI